MNTDDGLAKTPKYKRVYDELHEAIVGGTYQPGERLPSEAVLVAKFGTSRITVGRAFRDLQRQGLIQRRPGSGSYVTKSLRETSLTFGLLIPDLGQTEIFEPICQGMAQAERSSGHSLLWGRTPASGDLSETHVVELAQEYVAKNVSGVFFAPLELTENRDEINAKVVEAFESAGIRIVLLDRDIVSGSRRSRYDRIGIDNRRAGYAITEHLITHGCRRPVFIGRPNSAGTVDVRIAGFREALFVNGLEVGQAQVQRIEPTDQEAVRGVVAEVHPDGFVCANDFTAGNLMHTLRNLGVRVPEDIRIVGIDDVKYASLLPVPLTTIHQPCQEIGVAAIDVMLDRIAHPELPARDIFLDFTLVERESCGARNRA